jgi:hypothetical protein
VQAALIPKIDTPVILQNLSIKKTPCGCQGTHEGFEALPTLFPVEKPHFQPNLRNLLPCNANGSKKFSF